MSDAVLELPRPDGLAPYAEGRGWAVYCADAVELARALPAPWSLVCDPPWGIGFEAGPGGKDFAEAKRSRRAGAESRILGDDVPFDPTPLISLCQAQANRRGNTYTRTSIRAAFIGADNFAHLIPPGRGAWYTWDKSCGMGPADCFTDSEIIWMGARNARRIYRHVWKGRLRNGQARARLHISEKPVELMRWIMETLRVPIGTVVLDPYMGSGSTGVAALTSGRLFCGCDIDEHWCEVSAERLRKAEEEIYA